MGLHPEKAVSEILTSLKYEWKGSHHCNGRKPFTLQQTLSAIFCKDRNMMPSRFLIRFGGELDREAIYCKFSTEWQNRIPTSLLFPLGISKLGEPSAHLKSLKRERERKKKSTLCFCWPFPEVWGNFAIQFCFSRISPPILKQNKRINYRALWQHRNNSQLQGARTPVHYCVSVNLALNFFLDR